MGVNSPRSVFGPLWPDCLRPAEDAEAADWATASLWPWFTGRSRVGSFVPSSFEAFARIDHPPHEGDLPREVVEALVPVLGRLGRVERVWYAIWVGLGSWGPGESMGYLRAGRRTARERAEERAMFREAEAALGRIPQVRIPGREYYLFVGPLGCAPRIEISGRYQSAGMWWPDGREWFVATEVDATFTFVGASRACIDELLVSPELEAAEVGAHDVVIREDPRSE